MSGKRILEIHCPVHAERLKIQKIPDCWRGSKVIAMVARDFYSICYETRKRAMLQGAALGLFVGALAVLALYVIDRG